MQINWGEILKKILSGSTYKNSEHPKESYYNNKYPKRDLSYSGRPVPDSKKNISIDLRDFFMPYDSEVGRIVQRLRVDRMFDDDRALKCLVWVINNIKYVGDSKKGKLEFWQFPFETLYYKTGDCEDGAILLANMMLASGIPYWKIRLSVGKVKSGNHAYVNYYCESLNKWVSLDWCYYPSSLKVKKRPDYKDDKNYGDVFLSWNQRYCFSKGLNSSQKKVLS